MVFTVSVTVQHVTLVFCLYCELSVLFFGRKTFLLAEPQNTKLCVLYPSFYSLSDQAIFLKEKKFLLCLWLAR